MSTYEVETEDGLFEVDVEDGINPLNPSKESLESIGIKSRSFPKDVVDTALGFVEGRTMGIPRAAIEKTTDYKVPRGNLLGQTVGSIMSGKKLFDLTRKIPGLAKSFVRTGALTGGVGSQTPQFTEPDASSKERLTSGVIGASSGGLLGAIPGIIKTGGKLVRGLADIPSKSVKKLRELGAEKVFTPEMESETFLGKELTPKVQSIAKKSLNIPEEEIASLESQYKGSTTPFLERAKSALKEKTDIEEGKIVKILDETPLSKRIRLNEFRKELSNSLTGLFKGGKLRKDIPKEDLKPIRELIDMYKDKREVFDKTEFLRRRSRLTDLQQSPNGEVSRKATMLKDALDSDAEMFGMKGLREAKSAYKQALEKEGRFLNRNTGDFKFGESKLSKVGGNLPSQDVEALKELENYIGKPFIDELSKVNKLREFQETFKGTSVESMLKQAQNPRNYQARQDLSTLLSKDFGEVEKLLDANRIAQEFSPRGLYSSRAGIVKGAARAGLKSYEESVRPALRNLVRRKNA